jgi:tetratricopeptide (TPR) repeat protein
VDSYHQKYEQTLAELEKLKKDGKLKEQEYNDKLNELEDRYDSQLRNLDAYVDQFARIDLSELSEQEQQFIELAHAGRLDEAAEAYNSLNAAGKYITAVENIRRLNEDIAKLEDEKAKQQEAADAFFAMLQRQVNTLKLAGGEENYRKAGELLKRAALADTMNIKVVEEYADFAHNQKDYEDTERFFLICLNNCGNDLKRQAAIQNNLGNLYTTLRDYAKSEEYKLKSLETFTQLFNHDPDAYRSLLSGVQNNLAILYSDLQNYSQAEYYYFKALENRTMLYLQNPEIYRNGLADTQDGLGNLYSDLHEYAKAEEYYFKALEHRKQLFCQNPDAHCNRLAASLKVLGILYSDLHDYAKAEEYYLMALENYIHMFALNPEKYRVDLAKTQTSIMLLYGRMENWEKFDEMLEQALKNYDELAQHNSNYQEDLVLLRNTKQQRVAQRADFAKKSAINYYNNHDYIQSEEYFLQALENYIQLYTLNPNTYLGELASTQFYLGILYSDLHDYIKAEEFYLMALENHKFLFEKQPEIYREKLAWLEYGLMMVYINLDNNLNRYEVMLDAALADFEALYLSNKQYQSVIVDLRNRKGLQYLNADKIDEAMALFDSSYLLDPIETLPFLISGCNAKAYEYAKAGDYAKAIESIDRAIALMPEEANLYDSKGEILLMKGDEQEAVMMWKKVLELDPEFLQKHEGETDFYKQLKEKRLIE